MLDLVNVWLRYGNGVLALQGVDLRLEAGEFVFLVGQTGSGKSSLLCLINREVRPTSGEVWVDGQDVARLRAGHVPALRRKVGVVYQDFRLLPDRTIWENVAFALRVIGVGGRELSRRTEMALDVVGLADRARALPHQLSGGEQQRATIARAIVNHPPILLADEPTGNLDPDTSWEIIQLLNKINILGTTVLVASHDQMIVDRLQKRVVELDHGTVVRDEAGGRYALQAVPTVRNSGQGRDPRLRVLDGLRYDP
ncbi:MAG: cell division ATP-binding protein FtsE [Armatimonadetes bacterium]|nr:cell division ATP-binding protein FtsE [Armatimonadota bacterium]